MGLAMKTKRDIGMRRDKWFAANLAATALANGCGVFVAETAAMAVAMAMRSVVPKPKNQVKPSILFPLQIRWSIQKCDRL